MKEYYDWRILSTTEDKLVIKTREEIKEYKQVKKVIEKGLKLGKKAEGLSNEKFMIGFFIWEIKIFKLLMKTYPEEERLILQGESNRKVKENSYGGYYCIDKEKTFEGFEKKLKFLLGYSQYIEIEFIKLYGYNFYDIKQGYQLIEGSRKKKEIIDFLSRKKEQEKEKILLLVMIFYLKGIKEYINLQKLIRI